MRITAISIISIVALTLIWWFASIAADTPALPSPLKVWDAFVRVMNTGDPVTGHPMSVHIIASLKRFAIGFAIAFAVAVPFGLLIGYSRLLSDFTKPIIEVLRPIAPIAWAPVFIMGLFGILWGPIMVVFIGILFPMLTNTIFGVQKIDKNLIDAARTLGANKTQTFYKVMFPCTVPYIMSGIKIGLGIGWMCIIAAELYSGYNGGIGAFIFAQSSWSWPNVYVGIIFVSILGLLTTGLAEYAHKQIVKRMGME